MILIITHKKDYTVDFVVEKLNSSGHKYLRYNTEDLLTNRDISVQFNGKLCLKIRGTKRIKSVWFRRIKLPDLLDADINIKNYIHDELESFLNNLWHLMDAKWLSHPTFIYEAENKLFQLKEALNVGFAIPHTLVSSNVSEINKFYQTHEENVIIKPIYNNRFFDGKSDKLIFTNKLTYDYIQKLNDYLPLPSIFQSYIDKEIELRVTVVGKKVFSAYVDSQSDQNTKIDWRRGKLKFHSYNLPERVEEKCIALVKKLKLSFGAIDIIKDKKGNYIFLEINPNGQWAWIEMDTGLQISDAIISYLME